MSKNTRSIKLLITGGHVTPAIAVIREIKAQKLEWEVILIGRLYTMEGDNFPSEEYRLIKDLGIRFLPLITGRLSRAFGFRDLISLFKFPLGLITAFWYCAAERPSVIMSFGGYIALPVVLAARCWRIPVITHEQTRVVGLANRIISILAQRVCVSFPEMLKMFSSGKAVFTGLPIRQEIFLPAAKSNLAIDQYLPLIYITGGVTGAQSLNELIYQVLPALTRKFMIVHQTGRKSWLRAQEVYANLETDERKHYLPLPYLDVLEHSYVLHLAKLVIGRSGANTVVEMAATAKVGLFIPLPWSAGGEQEQNARYLKDHGSGEILEQHKATKVLLEKTIVAMMENIEAYQKKAEILVKEVTREGARRVVSEIVKVLHE